MHITDMNKSLYIYNCVFVVIIVKLWYSKKKKKRHQSLVVFCSFECDFEVILETHSRQLLSVKFCSKLFVS